MVRQAVEPLLRVKLLPVAPPRLPQLLLLALSSAALTAEQHKKPNASARTLWVNAFSPTRWVKYSGQFVALEQSGDDAVASAASPRVNRR